MRKSQQHLSVFIAAAPVMAILASSPAEAHEKYFEDASAYATDWSFFFNPLSLAMVFVVTVLAVVWRIAFAKLPSPELPLLRPFARLAPWIPRLLAIHLGISLIALGWRGAFLSPALSVHEMPGGDLLAFVEGALGLWFISGILLRPAAIGLALVGPASLLLSGPVSLLEALPLLGIAGFLITLPPSADRWGTVELDPEKVRRAMTWLRIGVAGGLLVLAFSEKFANPDLAKAIIEQHPQLNVFSMVGLDVSTETFIRIAGATELLFGLLVLSGAGAQVMVIVAGIPFNLTLLLFGGTELIGHLPVYGAFLALIVYGSHPQTSRLLSRMPTKADVAFRK